MYIAPDSIIRVLKNCPLDNTYDHTIYFASEAAQSAYFIGLTKYNLTNQTYQRVQLGKMRVSHKADDLYDCNYLMFKNTAYGDKWFYAFITSVEYVNNVTSEVTFEIDVMQTWFFDYTLGQCFIEREHASSDAIGENLVPENLELGEYITDDFDSSGILAPLSIVVAATFNESYDNISGSYYSGMFSGLYFNVFANDVDGAQACADFIQGAAEKTDGIVSVFLMPTAMVTSPIGTGNVYDVNKTKKLTLLRSDGSNVRNNKLLTYPYNFLYVTNLQGNSAEFHYELFSGSSCTFTMSGDMSPNPGVILSPTNYKGATVNFDEKIVLNGYPQLSFNTDTFKAWLAQNASGLGVNALSTAFGVGRTATQVATSTLSPTLGVASTGVAVAGLMSQVYQHSIMPHQAHGGGGSQTMASMGLLEFAFMHKHIQPQFATMIDDYFTMFGYATHRVKTPNRAVRQNWTYTKTVGCVVHGSVPADDMNKICQIYNNGVTFWRNGNNIGNYSLSNNPV